MQELKLRELQQERKKPLKRLKKNKRGGNFIAGVLISFIYVAFTALVLFTAYFLIVYALGNLGNAFLAVFGLGWDQFTFEDTNTLIQMVIPIFGTMLNYVLHLFETLMYWAMHIMGADPSRIPTPRPI